MANWQDRVKTDYVIATGDGAKYTPQWFNASAKKSVRYNVAKFEFKGLQGSLVKRGTSQGQSYDIEIIFQGADNIDVAASFKKSADNPGAWTITHPIYDKIYVQPVDEFEYDNSELNKTTISGKVIETLLDSGLAPTLQQPDIIAAMAVTAQTALTVTFVSFQKPNLSDIISGMLNHVNSIFKSIEAKIATVQADITQYQNLYNQTINTINTPINAATYYLLNAANAVQSLIVAPAVFVDNVVNRLDMLNASLAIVNQDIAMIQRIYNRNTVSLKKLYENNAGSIIAAICTATVTNITDDYDYRPDVISVINQVTAAYNTYLTNLISLQTANGGQPDSYIPDADSINALQSCVYNTVQALYSISAGALQPRTYTLPYDDNLINVSYLLYGSDPDDTKKAAMIANNNIGLGELLILKAGRKIVYYV